VKVTVGWLDSRKEARNRPSERQEVTVDGHKGMMAWVYPSGEVVFVYRYTPPGAGGRKKMRLGQYGESGITLAEAFDRHRDAERDLEKGLDPIEERERREAEREQARQERAGAETVANLVERFVHIKLRGERWEATAKAWVRESRANIKVRKRPDEAAALLGYRHQPLNRRRGKRGNVPTLISELGRLKARDVTRRQLIAFLDGIVARGAPITANRVYSLLVQMFKWAVAKDLVPASPMAGVERPGGDEKPRRRILTGGEIKTFWAKLDTAEMAEPTRLALKLLLATGQRRGELTFAKWQHFDLEAKLWTIPVELLKSSHARREVAEPHAVPLSPLAIELLGELKDLSGSNPFLLPAHADKRKKRSYSESVLSRAVRQNAKHFGIPHFTPHDLRRTAASFMTKLKVPRLHVEKVLNHATGDIAEVYDRHDYLPEKRAALERWGEHLREIIEGHEQKVIPLVRHG
jgi:integrase